MASDSERSKARKKALDLLAYREHSAHEMREKLRARGFENHLIDYVLDYLVSNDYLSDSRFAEMFVRQRVGKGFGELDVRARLRERGIDPALVSEALLEFSLEWDSDWQQHAIDVFDRRSEKVGLAKLGPAKIEPAKIGPANSGLGSVESQKPESRKNRKLSEADKARLVRFMGSRGFTTAQTITALKCCSE